MNMKKVQQGFTLIELMIVVAIIGILAAIAIPQYSDYTNRTKANGTIAELDGYRTAIAMCASEAGVGSGGTISTCGGGSNGVPNPTAIGNVVTISISNAGVISGTSTAKTAAGAAMSYTLTPTVGPSVLTWSLGGSGTSTICDNSRGIKTGTLGC